MKAIVKVILKNGILDPQGKAVNNALHHLGFTGVDDVRIGKHIEMNLEAANKSEAGKLVEEACKKLLANPVIEEYTYELIEEEK